MPDVLVFVIGLALFVAAIWPRPKSPEQVYISVVRPEDLEAPSGNGCGAVLLALILVVIAVVVLG